MTPDERPLQAAAPGSRGLFREAFALAGAIALAACDAREIPAEQRIIGGDAMAGRAVIASVACGVCHRIPGVRGAHGIVGPPLTEFGRRQFIAGIVANQPAVLVRWVKDAPSIAPNTGMPGLPLTDEEARDVAAYLYTLR
jgi:cytochrome c1